MLMFALYYKLEAVVAGALEGSKFDSFHFIHWEAMCGLTLPPNFAGVGRLNGGWPAAHMIMPPCCWASAEDATS